MVLRWWFFLKDPFRTTLQTAGEPQKPQNASCSEFVWISWIQLRLWGQKLVSSLYICKVLFKNQYTLFFLRNTSLRNMRMKNGFGFSDNKKTIDYLNKSNAWKYRADLAKHFYGIKSGVEVDRFCENCLKVKKHCRLPCQTCFLKKTCIA